MSYLTQPTRINELLVDSDQTYVSRKSMTIPSGATITALGTADLSSGDLLSKTTSASGTSDLNRDGELSLTSVSDTSAVLQIRSGETTYRFIADEALA